MNKKSWERRQLNYHNRWYDYYASKEDEEKALRHRKIIYYYEQVLKNLEIEEK